jgi:hypothetical protein
MKNVVIILACTLLYGLPAKAQADTSSTDRNQRDRVYWRYENRVKNWFIGNAWYMAAAYNLSTTSEVDVNIGRSTVVKMFGGEGLYTMHSWGFGYGRTWKNGRHNNLVKSFLEYSLYYIPPLTFTLRPEYMYNMTTQQHYLRPAAGLNLFYVDLLYHYSFKLNGSENAFKHGVTLRLKYFTNRRKWEHRLPR